jgi:hypothetical protein
MGVPELFALLDDWQRRAHGYLIVVVRMGVPDPLSIYVAYGDHALRHQVTRAVRSMRGARTLWWRGLNQSEDAIVREVFNDTCQRVWAPGLDDLDVGGRA